MSNYIDGFVFPIPSESVRAYAKIATSVAEIWKEHGALEYIEFAGDDMCREGLGSFEEALEIDENETIIFGWVVFETREIRDLANERVAADPRMADLVAPLLGPSKPIFNAQRMLYGGFKSLQSTTESNSE